MTELNDNISEKILTVLEGVLTLTNLDQKLKGFIFRYLIKRKITICICSELTNQQWCKSSSLLIQYVEQKV